MIILPEDMSSPKMAAECCGLVQSVAKRIIIDVPPTKRTIWFRPSDGVYTQTAIKLRLSFPQLRFALMIEERRHKIATYRLKKLYLAFVNEQNQLCWPHITNIYAELYVCMGYYPESPDIKTAVENTFNGFWGSDFDTSTRPTLLKYTPQFRGTTASMDGPESRRFSTEFMRDWHKKTEENPQWVPNDLIPWSNHSNTPHPIFT